MMVTITRETGLDRVRRWALGGSDPDEASLRRVGLRLAAFTTGLLAVLLLVLGVTIYLATQKVLFDSLTTTLQQRTEAVLSGPASNGNYLIPDARDLIRICSAGNKGGIFLSLEINTNQGQAIICGFDTSGTMQLGVTPGAQTLHLPDPSAAQQTLKGQLSSPFSTQRVGGTEQYLIYTAPIVQPGGAVVGVVQTSTSEREYHQSLRLLLQILLAVSVLGLLASAAISTMLARRSLQPIRVSMRRQRDFVADAAHELRTPLAIMRTAAELGISSGQITDQQVALEQALSQNAHLTRLVDSLSLLARADSGAVTLERQPVDLARLALETAGSVEILAEERDVRLDVAAAQETRVMGDAGRLRQLLLILLDNALKYTPPGGAIDVSVERQGKSARLQVRDTGPGIDPTDLPHLFARFYRADKARSGEGTGLGLAIGRWIAEAHGGQIVAANAPERGALFTVTLPLAT